MVLLELVKNLCLLPCAAGVSVLRWYRWCGGERGVGLLLPILPRTPRLACHLPRHHPRRLHLHQPQGEGCLILSKKDFPDQLELRNMKNNITVAKQLKVSVANTYLFIKRN